MSTQLVVTRCDEDHTIVDNALFLKSKGNDETLRRVRRVPLYHLLR